MDIAISKNNIPFRLTKERWPHISKEKSNMETIMVNEIKSVLPYFMKHKNIWTSYDQEADALYMHFKKPSHSDHSEITEDDIIICYEKDEIIGLTILNASKR